MDLARDLASRPIDEAEAAIPAPLRALTYDDYREINFRREHAFWQDSGSGWRLHLFHLGFLHTRPVEVNLVSRSIATPIPFRSEQFEYGKVKPPANMPLSMGFAGSAATYPLNDPQVQDEVISFIGGSYFRFLGRDHRYGLSARSLAIDIGGDQPEEFPFFRRIWLEEPREGNELTIHALVDSPSVVGAFRYVVAPGPTTTVAVQATLFPRREIQRIGIAPLTSMFLIGENNRQRPDFRPEIHDSDGLLIATGDGEWLWRPLHNPRRLTISAFADEKIRGFGLMQRDRAFSHYQDLEALYHMRPGYWVEPDGDWGPGRVELIEIPTADEVFDNIGCCWTPDAPLPVGTPTVMRYRLTALSKTDHLHPLGQVAASFSSLDQVAPQIVEGHAPNRIIVDFVGGDLAFHLKHLEAVEVDATITNGTIKHSIVDANHAEQGLRVIIDTIVPQGSTADMRLALRSHGRPLTETWTSRWSVAAT